MKEQLISIETAKLAYEKGFTDFHAPMPYLIFDDKYRPTQSLLQKWLREKHNIEVISQLADDFMYYKYKVSDISKLKEPLLAGFEYDSYESAFENGLKNALRIIKS